MVIMVIIILYFGSIKDTLGCKDAMFLQVQQRLHIRRAISQSRYRSLALALALALALVCYC